MSQTASAQTAAAKPNEAEQAASMQARPQAEHRWLQKLVGEWTYETDLGDKERPEAKATGTERGRSIGGLWVQLEGTGQMPGSGEPATSLMTLGFDPAKTRIIGSWIGSMMTHQWVYSGQLDAAKNRLVLASEGPSMTDENKMALYHDTIEFQSDDQRTLTASVQKEDGTWQPFMTVTYRRVR